MSDRKIKRKKKVKKDRAKSSIPKYIKKNLKVKNKTRT